MQAVILAGGLGQRMAPLTETIPKCLLPVGGRPFAEILVELLVREGVGDIVFCVGYLGEKVKDFLQDGNKWGVSISYSDEGKNLRGTAGALVKAESLLRDEFFLLYGDSYLLLDYRSIWKRFKESDKLGMMVIYRNDDWYEKSNIRKDGDFIDVYDKTNKTPGMNYINEGLSVLRKKSLSLIPQEQTVSQESFFNDLIARRQLLAYETTQRFYEIGSRRGLSELEVFLSAEGKHS